MNFQKIYWRLGLWGLCLIAFISALSLIDGSISCSGSSNPVEESPPPAAGGTPTGSPGTDTGGTTFSPSDLKAFPEAVGFAAYVTGGRGGNVCVVTNNSGDATQTNSLPWCLNQSGPQYIVFRVSGLIDATLRIARSDLTIAGQTSPGGIIVRGIITDEVSVAGPFCDQREDCLRSARKASNLIIRHLRTRPQSDDGLRIRSARGVLIDHLGMENAADEAMEIAFSNNVTVQNSIFAETLGDHLHNGTLLNYSAPPDLALDRITFYANTWNRLNARFPELSRESPRAPLTTMNIEIINNLLWDQSAAIEVAPTSVSNGELAADSAPNRIYYRLNWIGNYSFVRPDFGQGMMNMYLRPDNRTTETRVYFNDNWMSRYSDRHDFGLNYCCNDLPSVPADNSIPVWGVSSPLTYPAGPYGGVGAISRYLESRAEIRRHVFQNAGAFPRDPMDRRLMDPVCTGVISTAARNVNPAGDAYSTDYTTAPAAPTDTDNDGMPDDWERSHGLNPSSSDPNGHQLHAGYTNLEMYLNERANLIVSTDAHATNLSRCRF